MKKLTLHESQAPYNVALDDTLLTDEVIILEKNGEPVAALVPMTEYQAFQSWREKEKRRQARQAEEEAVGRELLIGLSQAELQALAESSLAPTAQARLNELLARNAEGQLITEEQAELDQLLEQIDQLTILKTRARYTLTHLASLTTTP